MSGRPPAVGQAAACLVTRSLSLGRDGTRLRVHWVSGALVLALFLTRSPAYAQSALLDAFSDRVTLAHAGGISAVVSAERIIRSGDTISTDVTGRAVVTYPDGSTALLEENSALTIEFVRTSAGDYAVRMQQTLGRVWYAVTESGGSG
jgi:hypothetical protein